MKCCHTVCCAADQSCGSRQVRYCQHRASATRLGLWLLPDDADYPPRRVAYAGHVRARAGHVLRNIAVPSRPQLCSPHLSVLVCMASQGKSKRIGVLQVQQLQSTGTYEAEASVHCILPNLGCCTKLSFLSALSQPQQFDAVDVVQSCACPMCAMRATHTSTPQALMPSPTVQPSLLTPNKAPYLHRTCCTHLVPVYNMVVQLIVPCVDPEGPVQHSQPSCPVNQQHARLCITPCEPSTCRQQWLLQAGRQAGNK